MRRRNMSERIKNLLDKAWVAYDEGNPTMPDSVFDALALKYGYTDFGSSTTNQKATHPFKMNSLRKVFDDEADPYDIVNKVESPKLDGTAISLITLSVPSVALSLPTKSV